jgi:hypothetical protein
MPTAGNGGAISLQEIADLCLAKIRSGSSGVPPRVAVVQAADTGK